MNSELNFQNSVMRQKNNSNLFRCGSQTSETNISCKIFILVFHVMRDSFCSSMFGKGFISIPQNSLSKVYIYLNVS